MRSLQIFSLLVVVANTACTAQNLCNRRSECREEEGDGASDDAAAVCVADFDAGIAQLRANEEEECHRLADAQIALAGCMAGLSCDDLEEADLGKECDQQLDEFNDAIEDIKDNECSAQED